jgi:type II secretory pathway pseudopilin PulG
MKGKKIMRIYSAKMRGFLARTSKIAGFSMVELVASMAITLIILAVAIATFSSALQTRERENSRVDALTSAQAAINIMTREIANSGYGIKTNGICGGGTIDCAADSGARKLHIRANISNNDVLTDDEGEDITFFYDEPSKSVLRYDANTHITSGVINRVSKVEFGYFDYFGSTTNTDPNTTPTANTGRVRINLWVYLPDVDGQPTDQIVQYTSDVTLRNSPYMLSQY